MTCIVGIVEDVNVIIGADSAGISGDDITIRKDPKIFKKGDFIIGGTTSFRMIQLLRFSLELPEIKGRDIYEYLCTDFVNAVRQCFKDGGFLQKTDSGEDLGGRFLIGYKNRLFSIEEDFQVGEAKRGYDAIGAGSTYALGVIHIIKEYPIFFKDNFENVLEALRSAQVHSSSVEAPFHIYHTCPNESGLISAILKE